LRQIQEEEFKEVERKILEQQLKETEDERARKEQFEKEEATRREKEEEEKRKEEQKAMIRKLKLDNLPEEPVEGENDSISIIFRLPTGERIERRFRTSDKAQVFEKLTLFNKHRFFMIILIQRILLLIVQR